MIWGRGRLDRLEDLRRRVPAAEHQLLAHSQSQTTAAEVGAKNWADVLAIRLRMSVKEAKRRVQEAQDLGPRTALTGEPLTPRLPATASAQARGEIDAEHVAIIRKCLTDAAVFVDATARVQIDQDLARLATRNTPETLRQAADRLLLLLNQDGDIPSDEHRARRRGVILGRQDADGMTPIRGWLDPELRASVDAVFAKLAAPGTCNPNDTVACVDGEADPDAVQRDTRSVGQRNHDALKTGSTTTTTPRTSSAH
jgi:hypothetical protein